MDLNTIRDVARPRDRAELGAWSDGDAFVGGGTWLFSEPQPHLNRLIDLNALDWEPLRADAAGLAVAATCTLAEFDAFVPPPDWTAAHLIGRCCRALLGSFKIWNAATVGGNLCMALPAGPMISLAAALDGVCLIWTPDGGERRISVLDFVTGPQTTALRAGEVLRRIDIPRRTLVRRAAFRRQSLSRLGRSGVLLIGTASAEGAFDLTVTAATRRPVRIAFPAPPAAPALGAALAAAIPETLYHDDMHGRPDWRRHMTALFAEEIRRELDGPTPGSRP